MLAYLLTISGLMLFALVRVLRRLQLRGTGKQPLSFAAETALSLLAIALEVIGLMLLLTNGGIL